MAATTTTDCAKRGPNVGLKRSESSNTGGGSRVNYTNFYNHDYRGYMDSNPKTIKKKCCEDQEARLSISRLT